MTAATGGFVPPGLPGHAEHIGLAYDPERARRVLADAGFSHGRNFPVIEAWGLQRRDNRLYRYLQSQWLEHLGVKVTWQIFESDDYRKQMATHTPHLFTFAWLADYPDPDSFLRIALHQQHWHNAQFEQLLDSARRVADPAQRLKFYQADDQMLVLEAGIMPLTYDRWHLFVKPWVKRYPISAVNASYWKDVIIEPH